MSVSSRFFPSVLNRSYTLENSFKFILSLFYIYNLLFSSPHSGLIYIFIFIYLYIYKHVQEKQSHFCTGYKSNRCLSFVHSIACFHEEQKKKGGGGEKEEKVMGMLDLGFLYLLLGVSFNQVRFRDGADGCGSRAM